MNAVQKYFADFAVLKQTRKEFWGLQGINILDSISYFAMFNIMVVTLSEDYGFSDERAGIVFGVFTVTTTIFLFISGLITDWIGIKKAIVIAQGGLATTRFVLVLAVFMPEGGIRNAVVIGSLFLMAPFMSMMQTVFQAGNKRFTTNASRGAGFNLWYLAMNVGAAGGGFVVDIFYLELGLPRFHVLTMGAFLGLISLFISFFVINRTDQLYGEGEEPSEEEVAAKKEGANKNPWELMKAVFKESVFWRFTALISLLLGVRAVFLYLALSHPKFWLRVIGPDAKIGALQALNPVLVIIGLVVLIPILNRFSVYKMLVTGALITSASLFILAIPPFGPFIGMDIGTFTYISTIAFLLVLTIGELIWSPRLSEYTAAIAPEGQEGTYLGLSMVPYFLAKTVISVSSGFMLARWCPEDIGDKLRAGTVAYTDAPYMMWVVLGSVALFGSLMALLLKNWFTQGADFEKHENGGNDEPKEEAA